ncbi:hypothetical protein Cgig2_007628 [Carnegiea gigantea]|uniref:Uncharacterized protein n=1 Tax=Carnegiea gigantea TaxID=171969 RepID=A0A9Q1GRP8_9CARY|nr:hypothetical protein Cgig2_007628 [Carnegiea gigantea]
MWITVLWRHASRGSRESSLGNGQPWHHHPYMHGLRGSDETAAISIAKGAALEVGLPTLSYLAVATIRLLSMTFLSSLDTKAIGEFVTCHFSWDRRGVAFHPSPLPKDFQTLCLGFELAMAEQAVKCYGLLELPQALTELRWSTFKSWVWLFGNRIYEARFHPKGGLGENTEAGRQEPSSGRGAVDEDAALEEAASP